MPGDKAELRRQSQAAHVLIAGAALIPGGAVGLTVVGLGSIPMILGAIPVGAILLYFGYRASAASKRGDVLYDDDDTSPYLRAGSQSFFLLVIVIMADDVFDIVPNVELSGVLVVVAGVLLLMSVLYYKYFPRGLLPSRGGRVRSKS